MKRMIFIFLVFFPFFVYTAPHIKSLIFTSSMDEISNTSSEKTGVQIIDVMVPDQEDFKKKMSTYLDKPIKIDLLNEIKTEGMKFYKKNGFELTTIKIPEGQDVSTGVVSFIVITAKLGQIKAHGAKYFSNEKIKENIQTKPGKIINTKKMQEDLTWINNNSFRTTNLFYESGDYFGETNIILETEDKIPFNAYSGYENTGNEIAGYSRYFAGIYYGNLWKLDHRFNLQFKTAPKTQQWWVISGDYEAPLPWRNIFRLFGSFVHSRTQTDPYTHLNGTNWNISTRYDVPIKFINPKQNFVFGYDFKRTNNFLTFSKNFIYDKYIDVSQFLLEYIISFDDRFGKTIAGSSLYLSPGNMTRYNRDSNFAAEAQGANSNYIYGKIILDRYTQLFANFSWVFKTEFQLATGKLLPSEQISLGGYLTVRGYQENDIIGDQGLLIKNDLYLPPITFDIKKTKCFFKTLGFIDFGWADDVNKNILDKNTQTISSIGLGCRLEMGKYLNARFDYGWQLKKVNERLFEKAWDSCAHFGMIIGF